MLQLHDPCECYSFSLWLQPPCAATRSPTRVCLCLKQPLWFTYRVAFWNFTDGEAVKVLNELKDEVRTEFHFALRPPFHCCDLCMPGLQAIQTVAPFLFFFFWSNILSCNSFRSLKPQVFMFAERAKCFAGLQRIYVWTCRSEVDSRRMLSSIEMWEARNMFRQFYGLSECPLWDRIRGFSRLMQTLFWYYSTEGLGLLHVLVCIY